MPDRDRQRSGRRQKQQGLNPIQATLKERTGEEKMFGRFQMITTKTRRWQLVAERNEALSGIEHPVRHLPAQIPDLPVQWHKVQGLPGHWPVKRTKGGGKFLNAMRLSRVQTQKQVVANFASDRRDHERATGGPSTQHQTRRGRGAANGSPRFQHRRVKRWETGGQEAVRVGKNVSGSSVETVQKPVLQQVNPTIWANREALHPLDKKRLDFEVNRDH